MLKNYFQALSGLAFKKDVKAWGVDILLYRYDPMVEYMGTVRDIGMKCFMGRREKKEEATG